MRQENGINPRRDSRASTDHEDEDEDELEEEEEEEDEGGGMRVSMHHSHPHIDMSTSSAPMSFFPSPFITYLHREHWPHFLPSFSCSHPNIYYFPFSVLTANRLMTLIFISPHNCFLLLLLPSIDYFS